jgi:hypothetical protein
VISFTLWPPYFGKYSRNPFKKSLVNPRVGSEAVAIRIILPLLE